MKNPGDAAAAYLRPEASAEIRRQIAAAGGNEVFFQGQLEAESGKVARVRVLSRGNQGMTPAVTGRLKPVPKMASTAASAWARAFRRGVRSSPKVVKGRPIWASIS